MSCSDRLVGLQAKFDRARGHIRDLESRIQAFRNLNPCFVVRHVDASTGKQGYRVSERPTVPVELGLVAGEAVHQLRSSLDHLAWQLVLANGGAPDKQTYFPVIEHDPACSVEVRRSFDRKVRGMSVAAIGLIDAAQPWRPGNEDLGMLHELDIVNKHRVIPVLAIEVTGVGFTLNQAGPLVPGSAPAVLGGDRRTAAGS